MKSNVAAAVLSLSVCAPAIAGHIHRCAGANGKVTFTMHECAEGGKSTDVRVPAAHSSPEEVRAAEERAQALAKQAALGVKNAESDMAKQEADIKAYRSEVQRQIEFQERNRAIRDSGTRIYIGR